MKRLALVIVLAVVAVHIVRKHHCPLAYDKPRPASSAFKVDGNMGARFDELAKLAPQRRANAIRWHSAHVVRVSQLPELVQPPTPQEPLTPPEPSEAVKASPDREAAPAWFSQDDARAKQQGVMSSLRTIKGPQSATQKRAERDARQQLDKAVADWLIPDVPRSWQAPSKLIDNAIVESHTEPFVHDYATLYKTGYWVDFTPQLRTQLIEVYKRQIGTQRLIVLGGGLGFALVCLAALAGYIRADEATKGYYTNRLRLAAAVGVGAAAMAIYNMIAHV